MPTTAHNRDTWSSHADLSEGEAPSHQPPWRWLDFVFILRPALILPCATIALLFVDFTPRRQLSVTALVGLLLVTAAAYVINQIHDRTGDRINGKLGFLDRADGISLPAVTVYYWLLSLAGILCGLWAHWSTGVWLMVSCAVGYIYSAPPIRAKDRAITGLVANALGFSALIWSTMCAGDYGSSSFVQGGAIASAFFAVAAVYLLTTIPDQAGDTAVGKRTFTVAWGRRTTLVTALVFLLATIVSAWLVAFWPFFVAAGVGLILCAIALRPSHDKFVLLAAKAPIVILTLFVFFRYPLYAAICLAAFALTRLYYRRRWGIVYPSLS